MKKTDLWIGARGWRHDSWVGDFYPDEMPQEWWLPYYCNEFEAVLAPWGYLQDAQSGELQSWLDDTNEHFRFFIELPLLAPKKQMEIVLETLAPRLGGILLNEIINVSDVTVDVIKVADCIEYAIKYAPIAVNWDTIAPSTNEIEQRFQLGCYWRPEEHYLDECRGGFGIAELDSTIAHDPKSLKNQLEHCRSVQGPTTIALVFGGDTPSIDEMRNAHMILQMLG